MATKKTAVAEEPVAKATKASATKETPAKEVSNEKGIKPGEQKAKASKAANVNSISHEMIRHKAYEIYLRTGNHNSEENWIAAEKELKANN